MTNRTKGTVMLIFEDKVICSNAYQAPSKRKLIIEGWRKYYGKMFLKCFIQISPEVYTERVNDDGKNIKYKPGRKSYKAKVYKGVELYRMRA